MTFQQLQILTACASTKSFSVAAQRLFLSTSSISKGVNSLEKELGFEIFVRSPNGIQLTEKGSELVKYARVLMQEYNNIVSLYSGDTILSFLVHARHCLFVRSPSRYYVLDIKMRMQ